MDLCLAHEVFNDEYVDPMNERKWNMVSEGGWIYLTLGKTEEYWKRNGLTKWRIRLMVHNSNDFKNPLIHYINFYYDNE